MARKQKLINGGESRGGQPAAFGSQRKGQSSMRGLFRQGFGLIAATALGLLTVLTDTTQSPAYGADLSETRATLNLMADEAMLIQLTEPATTVFVANPEIADIQVPNGPNATSFLVFGKKTGSTTVYGLTRTGKVVAYAVKVSRRTVDVAEALNRIVPNANVEVTSAPNGITISGHVASPGDAAKLKSEARQYIGDKENVNFNVSVDAATQVTLVVR